MADKKPTKAPPKKEVEEFDPKKGMRDVMVNATKKKIGLANALSNSERIMLIAFILLEISLGAANAQLVTSNGSMPWTNIVIPTIFVTVIALLASIVENQKKYNMIVNKTIKSSVFIPLVQNGKDTIRFLNYSLIVFHILLFAANGYSTYWSIIYYTDVQTVLYAAKSQMASNPNAAQRYEEILSTEGMSYLQIMNIQSKVYLTFFFAVLVQGASYLLDKGMGYWIAAQLHESYVADKVYEARVKYANYKEGDDKKKEEDKKEEGKEEKKEEKKDEKKEDLTTREKILQNFHSNVTRINELLAIYEAASLAISKRGTTPAVLKSKLKTIFTVQTSEVDDFKIIFLEEMEAIENNLTSYIQVANQQGLTEISHIKPSSLSDLNRVKKDARALVSLIVNSVKKIDDTFAIAVNTLGKK